RPPRLHGPGHPRLPARETAVHDEPQGYSLLPRLARRASPGAPREPAEARDPAPDRRPPPAPGGAEGRAEPRRGSHVARDGPRDRADDPRRRPRDRVAEGPAVERSLGLMCGAGELPALMASEARRRGWRVVAFAFARDTGAAAHAARVVPAATTGRAWAPACPARRCSARARRRRTSGRTFAAASPSRARRRISAWDRRWSCAAAS